MNRFYQKKIAVICPYFGGNQPTGSEILTKRITELLASKNKVVVFTSNITEARYFFDIIKGKQCFNTKQQKNIEIVRFKHSKIKALFYYLLYKLSRLVDKTKLHQWLSLTGYGPQISQKELEKELNRGKFDIIYSSPLPYKMIFQTASIIAKMKNKPKFILTPLIHQNSFYFKNSYFRKIFNQAQQIHVLTETEKKFLKVKYQIKNKITVINPLIEFPEKNTKLEETIAFKKENNLYGKKVLLFAGTKNTNKGIYFLIKTVEEIYKKNKRVRLITIGKNTTKWQFFKLSKKTPYLIDFGYVGNDKKNIIFELCDLVCLVSDQESFGLTFIDSWLYKKPIVAVDSNVNSEIIKKSQSGILVQRNSSDIEKTLLSLLDNNHKKNKLAHNGYSYLEKNFQYKKLAKRYLSLFDA